MCFLKTSIMLPTFFTPSHNTFLGCCCWCFVNFASVLILTTYFMSFSLSLDVEWFIFLFFSHPPVSSDARKLAWRLHNFLILLHFLFLISTSSSTATHAFDDALNLLSRPLREMLLFRFFFLRELRDEDNNFIPHSFLERSRSKVLFPFIVLCFSCAVLTVNLGSSSVSTLFLLRNLFGPTSLRGVVPLLISSVFPTTCLSHIRCLRSHSLLSRLNGFGSFTWRDRQEPLSCSFLRWYKEDVV